MAKCKYCKEEITNDDLGEGCMERQYKIFKETGWFVSYAGKCEPEDPIETFNELLNKYYGEM